MSPDDWTDDDFIPREPDPAARPDAPEDPRQAEFERREWLRREIRSRLGEGQTQPQVVAWLVGLGLEPGAAAHLVAWASSTTSVQNAGTGDRAIVLGVERHYEPGLVVNDVTASAAARAAARRRRAGEKKADAPAPEFEFARPSDSTRATLDRSVRDSRTHLLFAAVIALALCTALAAILF